MNRLTYISALVLLFISCISAYAENDNGENDNLQFVSSIQAAGVFSGYNRVRLPGNTGSTLSYTKDLDTNPSFSPRFEAGFLFFERHYLGFMGSLLTMSGCGTLDRNINYDGKIFTAGSRVKAIYRFDSYRMTYRYDFFLGESFRFGAGLTGKIRVAEISLETESPSAPQNGSFKNTGVVPLINFLAEWYLTPEWTVYTYGDWLVTPYGRAEDIFLGTRYSFNNPISIIAGYRMLEGGSDSDKVYTFAFFHYVVLGIEIRI